MPGLLSACLHPKRPIFGPCTQAFCLDEVSSISTNIILIRITSGLLSFHCILYLPFNLGWSFNVCRVEVMWFIDLTTIHKLIVTVRVTWWSNIQNYYWIHNFGVLNICMYFLCTKAVCCSTFCDMTPLLGIQLESNNCLQALWIVLLVVAWIM